MRRRRPYQASTGKRGIKNIFNHFSNAHARALGHIYELHTSGKYDVIVWDTAPAGGTLSLLNLQDTFYRHMDEAACMYVGVRTALDALVRGRDRKDPLKMIAKWEALSKNVLDMMKTETTKAFVVTNPEALCVSQARRVVKDLDKFGITVAGIVLNRVLTEEAADSSFNKSRREVQLKYIKELDETYHDTIPIILVPMMSFEVKGLDALEKVGKVLFPNSP